MTTPVTLPQLGESVTEGTVTRWLKNVGDHVEVDEPLLEVSTDKVDTEIPSPVAGTLVSISAQEDDIVQVGAELARIGAADQAPSAPPAPPAPEPAAGAQASAAPTAAPATPVAAAAPPPAPAAPVQPPVQATPVAAAAPQPPPAPASASAAGAGSAGTEVTLPELGESVTEGTVTRWLKTVGEQVAVDEPLVEISTDKVDTEIPSPVAGILQRIVANEDEIVAVGGVLAVVGAASAAPDSAEAAGTPAPAEPIAASAPSPPPAPAPTQSPAQSPAPPGASGPTRPEQAKAPEPAPTPTPPKPPEPAAAAASESGPAYVTPLVRKLAKQHGVDLAKVSGTGIGGRIRRQDVLAAAEQQAPTGQSDGPEPSAPAGPPSSPVRGRVEKLSRLRKVIAERMVESLHVSAQLTTVVEADVSRIAQLRGATKKSFESREGVKLSFLPFFAKAVVEALKVHPVLNASIDLETGTVTYHDAEHLGVAVDTERGLLVPVIRDAGDLNVTGLARKIADLAERTRTNKVTPDELSGGTFTLTNTGSRGALFDTPIINQPQVAILGMGSVVKRPVVVQGPDGGNVIAVRSMVYLALTYDHRLVDGADAARFLETVKARLEEGSFASEV